MDKSVHPPEVNGGGPLLCRVGRESSKGQVFLGTGTCSALNPVWSLLMDKSVHSPEINGGGTLLCRVGRFTLVSALCLSAY